MQFFFLVDAALKKSRFFFLWLRKTQSQPPTHKFQIMPLTAASCTSTSLTGNNNLTLTSTNRTCSSNNNTFVGYQNIKVASTIGNLAKVFRAVPDDDCTTPYLCHKKCECEQISTIEPAVMVVKERNESTFCVKFNKLGEVCLGATLYYNKPAYVVVSSKRSTAQNRYAFLSGEELIAGDNKILLPMVDVNDPRELKIITRGWEEWASDNGYGVDYVAAAAYPIVESNPKFGCAFLAGTSTLNKMDSFTVDLMSTLMCDVDAVNPALRAKSLMLNRSELLIESLRGSQESQAITLSSFKTRCNALPNRAALFQELTLEVSPPTLAEITHNELLLTSDHFKNRARLSQVLPTNELVSTELMDNVILVNDRFFDQEISVRRALMGAKKLNELSALVAVLSTIAVAPVEDDGTFVGASIVNDSNVSLQIDGAEDVDLLEENEEIGTLLHTSREILFASSFLEKIFRKFSDSSTLTLNLTGMSIDLNALNVFGNPKMAPHNVELSVDLYGMNEDAQTIVQVEGTSVPYLMESLQPSGINAISSEVFLSDATVMAELEKPKETLMSEVNCSTIHLTKSDLNGQQVAKINYTQTKPIAFVLLVVSCEALLTDVYQSASSGAVSGIDFESSPRPTHFGTEKYPDTYLVTRSSDVAQQYRDSRGFGSKFRQSPIGRDMDILRCTVFQFNGVEMNDVNLPETNPMAVENFFNKFATDTSRTSVRIDIKGVYLLTFTSEPFGMSDKPYEHDCMPNFMNVVRIESVELILKFNPKFFEHVPHASVQVDLFCVTCNIKRQMSGLMGNLLAPET